jgi:hypothetical protein
VHVEGGQQRGAGLRVPWTVIRGTRAAVMHRSKLRLKLRGSIGVPCLVVKIRPIQGGPEGPLAPPTRTAQPRSRSALAQLASDLETAKPLDILGQASAI